MPFKKVDVQAEIDKRIQGDSELNLAYKQAQAEYEIIKRVVQIRNELGISQQEIAEKGGLTQQMISRIETVDNSPTLRNFIKYIDALGLEISFTEKKQETRM